MGKVGMRVIIQRVPALSMKDVGLLSIPRPSLCALSPAQTFISHELTVIAIDEQTPALSLPGWEAAVTKWPA